MKNETLTSLQNPLVKHVVKLRNEKEYRYEQKSVIVEGIKPVLEVAPFIKKVFYIESLSHLVSAIQNKWAVSPEVMAKMTGMQHPEGLLAEVVMPEFSSLADLKYIVALDNINDPGNMGTLLRTALALGWEGLYILENSCDPFNEKVLRAARGAHFRLPIAFGFASTLRQLIQNNGLKGYAADVKGCSPNQVDISSGVLLVLGNEAHGCSEEVLNFCSKVSIPMPGEMESLNVAVAGGILMYAIKKK